MRQVFTTPLVALLLLMALQLPTLTAHAKPSKTSKKTPEPKASADDLKRFEEETFPRPAAGRVLKAPPAAPPRAARKSAINPPAGVRSHGPNARRRRASASATARKTPPVAAADAKARAAGLDRAFLGKLQLPDLPVIWSTKLLRYLDFYKNNARGRRLMRHWLARAGRYQRLISDVLAKHKLPRALAFVAMVESSFNPTLTSRVGAAGIWQFMPRSGRWYGLARDYWIDERRNPERSTDSAARLLKRLRGMFGTWELALAAYNAGAGAVIVAMKRYNTNDYYQLCRYEAGLPWATTLYVPKILATAIVANNRAAFGFADVKGDAPLAHDLVALPRSLSVRQIARAAGVDRDVVETYNPELRRGRTPPGKSWIRLPKGKKKGFYEALAKLGSARYRPYTVRLGESDTSLAARFGISRTRLRAINGVQHARELRPGTTILVPARVKPQRKHKRRRGKRKRSVSARDDDDSATVLVALPPGVPRRVSGRRHVFYRTVVGDSIDEIAKHLDVSAADLAAWNGLDPRAKLVSEMVLQAFIKPSFDTSKVVLLPDDRVELVVAGSAEHMRAHLERDGRRRVVYTARRGDTLVRLSRRFGLSIGSIMRINRFSRSTKLEKGQKLVIYMHKDPRVRRRKAREIARARYKRVVRMRRAKLRARRRKLRDKRRRQRQARLRRKTQRAKN